MLQIKPVDNKNRNSTHKQIQANDYFQTLYKLESSRQPALGTKKMEYAKKNVMPNGLKKKRVYIK